ncbi:hypothetical protein SPRG_16518 [Saprolegnia parasitica CBS 223.65]|uniref:Uncharacterized protein n=1 Tax=Saprolegnia parasitica (strain CBS 223.65) TaxID=695850 RepID=A0A067BMV4_SAPPC|nr:hypothetical protein SPRG_16518 [Saprolegnia parasitica CBS 223.65]KDO18080.1 hypothetical protein SPRG_16518 [Saprolegnia parasitica CBS 223.65]|eukprot:XP_012211214.1 hypothetical protein SPRG_16518 [Saprolegnia parasitica CBS 223.65]
MRASVVDAAVLAKIIKPFSDTMASTLQGVQSAFLSHVPVTRRPSSVSSRVRHATSVDGLVMYGDGAKDGDALARAVMRFVSRLALTTCTTASAHSALVDLGGVLWVRLHPAGNNFSKYFGKALPMIVAGISDESDIPPMAMALKPTLKILDKLYCDAVLASPRHLQHPTTLRSILKPLMLITQEFLGKHVEKETVAHLAKSMANAAMFSGVCLCLAEVIPSLLKTQLNPESVLKVKSRRCFRAALSLDTYIFVQRPSHYAHASGKGLEAFLRTSTLK